MDSRIGGAIFVVKLITDIAKSFLPWLNGRKTQLFVLALSILAGVYAADDPHDFAQILSASAAIFAGAVTADQIIKKMP